MTSKKSFIISGPTASGKSDFAAGIATRLGGTIINADSVQIYRGLEILSAAPPADTGKLYSIIEPGETCSAGRYAALAHAEFDAANIPIFVGGTGFYLSTLTRGLSDLPNVSAASRAAAAHIKNKHFELQKCDPVLAEKLHPNDTQRLTRALAVFIETGRPLSEFQASPRRPALPGNPVKIAILPPREILLKRAGERREWMIKNGAIEQVKNFINLDIRANGFAEIARMLRGEISQDEMMRLWAISDAQYIKRQFTWLRHQFDADITIDHIPNAQDINDVCSK